MFKRKIYNKLIEWKNNPDKKALIIKGARQVGKTTLVKEFAKNNYKNYIYFDFRADISLHNIFEGDFNIDNLLLLISAKFPNIEIEEKNTVFIFDEIQDCLNARSSLKYFVLDGRFDVICTGSMLGVKGYRKTTKVSRGVPVGYEEQLEMTSMDFEEFLWANQISDELILTLRKNFIFRKGINKAIHELLLDLFRKYICVGGMPEVVKTFIETKNMQKVQSIQRRIISSYESDFGTHLNDDLDIVVDKTLYSRILECFHSIPAQLAKENKKFQFSKIKQGAQSKDYFDAIEWLIDAGIVAKCHNVSALEKPLNVFEISNIYKLYVRDTGLLVSMLDDDAALEILSNNLGIAKGAIYENIVADALKKMGRNLYYFQKQSGMEIDFIINYKCNITLLEVKAISGDAKAAKVILNDNIKYPYANNLIKLTSQNIGEIDNILTMPYYLTFLLES